MTIVALDTPAGNAGFFGGAAYLFQNLEGHPGELFTKPPLQSARSEARQSRRDIVKAARHLERYSEHIRGGIDKKTDYTVGPRLMVNPKPDWEMLGIEGEEEQEALVKSMNREFRNWAYDTRLLQDGERHYDFGGMMWLAFRNLTGPDGEAAGIIHYDEKRAKKYRTRWATYFTVIDPDRICTPPEYAGNANVEDGIIMDRDGARAGFFVKNKHPGDGTGDISWTIVDRETDEGRPVGLHWFVKNRASALRGISTLVTIIKQTGMVDKFDDAYLGAAIINQVMATWIQSAAPAAQVVQNISPGGEEGSVTDPNWGLFTNKLGYYDKVRMRIGGARVPVMPPGDEIKMSTVERGMSDPGPTRDGFLRMMASSLGLSFEQFAQKFGEANFSAARAAIMDAWVNVLKLRLWFGQHFAALIYGAVMEEAFKKGRLDVPKNAPDFNEYRAAWTACEFFGPSMPQVDPLKEANAFKVLLETKLTSRQEIMATMGKSYIDVFDQIAKERKEAEDRDFELDPLAPGTAVAQDQVMDGDSGNAGDAPAKKGKKTSKGASPGRDGDGDGKTNEDDA